MTTITDTEMEEYEAEHSIARELERAYRHKAGMRHLTISINNDEMGVVVNHTRVVIDLSQCCWCRHLKFFPVGAGREGVPTTVRDCVEAICNSRFKVCVHHCCLEKVFPAKDEMICEVFFGS